MSRAKARFESRLVRSGPLYAADVPASASRAMGARGKVLVTGSVNGHPFSTTMTPRAGGGHRVFLNAEIREGAGATLGDRVTIVLAIEDAPVEEPLPEDLAEALAEQLVTKTYEALTLAKRNEIACWVENAASAKTREKRVAHVLDFILARYEKAREAQTRIVRENTGKSRAK